MSVVDCNEGFIFVDTGDSTRAKQLFRRGLQTETSADCEAGLAIALFASGDSADSAEAQRRYQAVRKRDDNYANTDVLSKNYFWSRKACSLVERLRTVTGTIASR
jgi:hypothetical protein